MQCDLVSMLTGDGGGRSLLTILAVSRICCRGVKQKQNKPLAPEGNLESKTAE